MGPIGVWLGPLARIPAGAEQEAAQELESLGYSALWPGEGVGTREPFAHAALLLSWTRSAVVATGIASIYARDAMASAAGAATLAEAYPGRFVLGLGVSHAPLVAQRGSTYGRPLAAMRGYLDALDAAPYRAAAPERPAPVVLAALGPRMLDLARERSAGAHPYFVPVEHTAFARERLGPGPLLAPEQAVVLERDASAARARAREHMRGYLGLPNYRRNLERLGFGEEDLDGQGSDRLVDAIVAWGDAEAIAARVHAHLDAGADHVAVQALGDDALAQLRELAPVLLER
jgi:probable F420-dependent oxidoreductase